MFKKLNLLCLAILLGLGSFSIAYAAKPNTIDISVDGPGALYIGANSKNEVFFWVLDSSKAVLIQTVTVVSQNPTQVNVNLKQDVSGIFYADNLPLGNDLTMTFNGDTSGTKACPLCDIMMPLPSDSFIPLMKEDAAGIGELEDQQRKIYQIAGDINKKIYSLGDSFVEGQKDNVADFYLENKALSGEGNAKLIGYRDEILSFEPKISGKAVADAAKTKQIAEKYGNYILSLGNLKSQADACSRYEKTRSLSTTFVNALNLKNDTDDNESTPNGTDNPRNAIIDNYEAQFEGLFKDGEKCTNNLFANFLTAVDDVNFPGSTPNLSQGNFISAPDYETIGNQLQDVANRADTDFEAWQKKIETDTAKFDKLKSYVEIRETAESYFEDLWKYVSPKVLKDEPPKTKSVTATTGKTVSTAKTAGSQNTCNSNVVFTINLNTTLIIGSFWNDKITGGNKRNVIFGFGGDDCIYGKDEFDFLFAGAGDDLVDGGDNHDFVFGGKNNDTIFGGEGKTYTETIPEPPVTITYDIGNFISGDAGDDTIYGMDNASPINKHGYADVIIGDGFADDTNAGIDWIDGDRGIDFIFGQGKNDVLKNTGYGSVRIDGTPIIVGSFFFGNRGNDMIFGTDTPLVAQNTTLGDFIFGNDDDDTIAAGQGQDFCFGFAGNDSINGGDGNDFLFGNLDSDTIHVDDGMLNLALGNQGTDSIYGDGGAFNALFGNAENDFVQGGNKVDLALGNAGDDRVYGGDGIIDALFGGTGKDEMRGEAGLDAIFGNSEADNIKGGANIDLIFGGDGIDWADGEGETDIIFGNKNTANDTPKADCLQLRLEPEKLMGSGGIDLIFGNSGCDELFGGTGIDALFGGDGNDFVRGENDSDLMFGNIGDDKMFGGGSIDIIFGNEDDDSMGGEDDADLLIGNSGNDVLFGDNPAASTGGADFLLGGSGDDKLYGVHNTDFIFGGEDRDTIEGNNDGDVLFGGDGDDSISGGTGALDVVFGGKGNDLLNGDDGADIIFGGEDDDIINGGNNYDILFGREGSDTIDDGGGDDLSFGGAGDDRITAIDGINIAFGNAGGDKMCATGGGEPRDLLFGNKDSDTLAGNKPSTVSLVERDFLFLGQGGSSKIWNNGCP